MISKVVYLITLINSIHSARILGVFPAASISHQFVYQPIWKELALRGHQVTVISPNILKENITNLKEIDVGYVYEMMKKIDMAKFFGKNQNVITFLDNFYYFQNVMFDEEMKHPEVQEILKATQEFDLVLAEVYHPVAFAFGAKFGAPVVAVSSGMTCLNTQDAVGNPTHPVIVPDAFAVKPGALSLPDRLQSFLYNIYYRLIYEWRWLPQMQEVVKKHFGDDMPYIGDIERNISLLLTNVNPLMNPVRPNVPAVVELSQMHIKPKKPLPKDIKKFLDDSKDGVIYFSLGSNVKSSQLSENIREVLTKGLGALPYKVLWKWETDDFPGRPDNVMTRKWLPQQDILGHPNVKAFVTHGGIQSIEEAITNEMPMVGIPFIGDQPSNVAKLVELGIGRQLEFATMTNAELEEAILDVVQNKKYKENIKEIKSLLTDHPQVGVEKAVWWIEYVLRHKGAKHLASPTRDMPYWKYFCLDVIGFLILACTTVIMLTCKIVKLLLPKSKSNIKYKSN